MSGDTGNDTRNDTGNATGRDGATTAAPVTYVITFTLKPGCEAGFLSLLTPVLDAMRCEAGFINAVLHRDPEAPERFMLYETWRDHDEVMAVETNRPYRQPFWAGLPDLLARPREAQVWRPLRGDGRL